MLKVKVLTYLVYKSRHQVRGYFFFFRPPRCREYGKYSRIINPSDFFIPHDCASHFVSPRVDDRFADPALRMASQATSPDPQAPTGPPTYKSDQIL